MSTEFHLVEYEALREEILQVRQARDNILVWTVGANAAIISWIITSIDPDKSTHLIRSLPWIPVSFTVFSWLYWNNRNNLIKKISGYILVIESKFSNENMGWERHLRDTPSHIAFGAFTYVHFLYLIQIAVALAFAATSYLW